MTAECKRQGSDLSLRGPGKRAELRATALDRMKKYSTVFTLKIVHFKKLGQSECGHFLISPR